MLLGPRQVSHTQTNTHTHRHRQDQIKEMKRKFRGVRKLKKHQAKKLAMQSGRSFREGGGDGRKELSGGSGVAASLCVGVCAHGHVSECVCARTIIVR